MAEITNSGLTTRTTAEVLEEIQTDWTTRDDLGPTFDRSPDAPQTQLSNPVAEAIAQVEEALAAVVAAMSLEGATGQALDDIGALQGLPRQQATYGTTTLTLNLDAGVTVLAGALVAAAADSNVQYATDVDVTNAAGIAADVTVAATATVTGAGTFAIATQLATIVSPQAGWNTSTNIADTELGLDRADDATFRLSIANAPAQAGSGTVDAIRSAVDAVDAVTSAGLLENQTNTTDGNGLPGGSFEIVALGGADNSIAQAIWDNKPAGIADYGSTTGAAVDIAGNPQSVDFSRPTEVPVYLDFTLTTAADYVGDTEFKAALVLAAAAEFGLGAAVVRTKLIALAHGITGVTDVTLLELDTSASPAATANLSMTPRQLPTFDTGDVTIV